MKFPKLLHVTVGSDGRGDEWLEAHKDGVFGVAEAGSNIRCALYKLIEVGTVEAPPKYNPPKRKQRR